MFKLVLLAVAVVVFISSSDLPRARLWITAGVASYVLSLLYSDFKLPYAPAFAVVCDFVVCWMIYALAKQQWELKLMLLFQLSIILNILELGGYINARYLYVYALDVVNLLALMLIGGISILEREGYGRNHFPGLLSPIFRVGASLQQARDAPPFWTVK